MISHESRAFRNGISALIKQTPESLLIPSFMLGHSKKMNRKQALSGSSPNQWMPDLSFPDSEL